MLNDLGDDPAPRRRHRRPRKRRRARVARDSGLYRSWQQPSSPLEQAQAAIRALGEIPHSRVVAVSSFYRTPPLGRRISRTISTPPLRWKPPCPRDAARSYSAHRTAAGASAQSRTLGPRTWTSISCCFGDAVINSERLTVPHYDMKNRGFMLWPLFEIARTFTF